MGVARHRFALALVSVLPVFAALFVALRLIARYRRRIKYSWDDYLLIIAAILCFALIPPSILQIQYNHVGYHVWEWPYTTAELTNRNYNEYYGITLSFNLISIPILPLAKASIILLLLRVGRVITTMRRFLYGVFFFNVAACIVPWAVFIFACPPATGDTSAPRTFGNLRCLDRGAQGELLLFVNCANLTTDVLIFPIPFFILRELMDTDTRAKMTILTTFASSLCVTALSALKIHVTYRDRILLYSNSDWMYSLEFCITHGEAVVGIIVACLPTLRGLFTKSDQRSPQNMSPRYYSFRNGTYHASITGGRNALSNPSHNSSLSGAVSARDILDSKNIMMTTIVEPPSSPSTHGTMFRLDKETDPESGRTSSTDLVIQGNCEDDKPPVPTVAPAHINDRLSHGS